METVEMENKPPHANEDGLERDEAVTEKLVGQSDGTKITFTNSKADGKDRNGDAKIDIQGVESQFVGLSKEELMKYANDPFWVRLRMTLFVLFWVLWLAMLVGAVAIIVLTPRCAPPPRLAWWQSSPVYNVDVDKYADSDGDGHGDIAGLTSKLKYIKELGMRTLLLSDIFLKDSLGATRDYLEVDPSLGTLTDVEALLNATKEQELHVVLEINPAYTSRDHQWFQDSSDDKDGFQDVFIWEQGDEAARPEGEMAPSESAWTYEPIRHAFYLHQASFDSADVNWKSPKTLELFTGVLRFWLERGVSGFLVSHTYLDRAAVAKQATFATEQDVLGVLKEWRQVLGNYSSTHETEHRLLGVRVDKVASEASPLYGSSDEPAADLVLSKPFELLGDKPAAASLRGFVQETLDVTPEGMWPSFVLGSSSSLRLKERVGMLLDGLHMVAALVQGTPIFYNGDELALECSEKTCPMPWAEEGAANLGVSAEALLGNSSHLEVVRHSTELRDKLAVRLGTTVTSVLGANSTVFVMLRVRKGTPGYMVVVNGDGEPVTVNLADASSHVPESGHIEVKSTDSTKVVQSKVKLNEFALDGHEAVILQFVPIFE
uniref:alpha-glucosidase n=1 Tax=Rhipicephalus pulchellus TaxID=72859 RepID=L7M7H7_RHIPC